MIDIVERLRSGAAHQTLVTTGLVNQAADEITRLTAENFSLASWQCEFTDGKTGLVSSEGGSTYCAMAKRVEALRAEVEKLRAEVDKLRAALEPLACTCDRPNGAACSRSEVDCPFWSARAALSASQPAPSALPVLSDEFVRAEMDAMQARENKRLETLFTQPAPQPWRPIETAPKDSHMEGMSDGADEIAAAIRAMIKES